MIPASPRQTNALAIGVRNPIISTKPAIAIEMAASVARCPMVWLPVAIKPAWTAANAPTTTRNTSNAMPAQPDGKLENVLCRDVLLADPATRIERTGSVDAGRSHPQGTRRYHYRGMSAWGRGLDMDDAAANADGDGLCSILRAEFVHDVLDVDFHGLFRDRKALANVPIAVALGNLLQDLHLALGQ
jgi:hypothetical protein